jgi:APA family basic amino acid/polyamine antiporter
VFRLRKIRATAMRPYRALGYPAVPALYLLCACVILGVLFVYRRTTTIPGLIIVVSGIPVYFAFKFFSHRSA